MCLWALALVIVFAVVVEVSGLAVLGLAAAIGTGAVTGEALAKLARRRREQINEAWPSVLESLESAVAAGMSLLEAFRELAESHNLGVAGEFADLVERFEAGGSLDDGLVGLARSIGLPSVDLTIEVLRQVSRSGGQGLAAALRRQGETARQQQLLIAEVRAKQGWVLGTAKLAVAAPWVVICLVSLRPENARLYAQPTGQAITLLGLVASIFAFRLVAQIGRVETAKRVFAW